MPAAKKSAKSSSSSSSEPPARTSSRKRPKVDYNEEKALDEMVSAASAASGSNDSYKKPRQDMANAPAIFKGRKPLPTRSADGKYHFADHPEFMPNLRSVVADGWIAP